MARKSSTYDPPTTHMLPSASILYVLLEAVNRGIKSCPRTNLFFSILASVHTADEKGCSSPSSGLTYRCKMLFTEIRVIRYCL